MRALNSCALRGRGQAEEHNTASTDAPILADASALPAAKSIPQKTLAPPPPPPQPQSTKFGIGAASTGGLSEAIVARIPSTALTSELTSSSDKHHLICQDRQLVDLSLEVRPGGPLHSP